jgi:hypothetical protein
MAVGLDTRTGSTSSTNGYGNSVSSKHAQMPQQQHQMHWLRADRLHQWKTAVDYIGTSTLLAVNDLIREQQIQLEQIISRPPSQAMRLRHASDASDIDATTSSGPSDIDFPAALSEQDNRKQSGRSWFGYYKRK